MTRYYTQYDHVPDSKLEEFLFKEMLYDIRRGGLSDELYTEMIFKMPEIVRRNSHKEHTYNRKYRIVEKRGLCSGRIYYVVQKKFLFFWYYPDKEGCAVHPGDLATTPRQHETIDDAKKSIEFMTNKKIKHKQQIIVCYE